MKYAANLPLVQHWISYICHELVSPIGAINNGIELIAESPMSPPDHRQDALDLIAESGRIVAAKLRFFRVAYGLAGTASDISLSDIRKTALDFFAAEGRIALSFEIAPHQKLAVGVPQLILNLLLMASHCLPRGGKIGCQLLPAPSHEPSLSVYIEASGTQARLPESSQGWLRPDPAHAATPPALDHRNCHAAMCASLVQNLAINLTIESAQDAVIFCFDTALVGLVKSH